MDAISVKAMQAKIRLVSCKELLMDILLRLSMLFCLASVAFWALVAAARKNSVIRIKCLGIRVFGYNCSEDTKVCANLSQIRCK